MSGPWGQVPQTERSRAAGGTGEREVPGSLPKTMKHGGRSSTQSAHTHRQPHPRAIAQGHVAASAASQVCPRGSLWLCDKVTCVCFWSRARVESHGKGRATAQEAETALCRVRPACHGWKVIAGQVGPPSQRPGPVPPRAQRDGKPGPLFGVGAGWVLPGLRGWASAGEKGLCPHPSFRTRLLSTPGSWFTPATTCPPSLPVHTW